MGRVFHASTRRGKRQTGAPRHGRYRAWWLAGLLVLSGCGYGGDVEKLPEGAGSLGIGPVRNLTFTGELDLEMGGALRERLSRNPAFLLKSPLESQLVLEIALTELAVTRSRSLVSAGPHAIATVLTGTMTLRRRRDGRALMDRVPLAATAQLNFTEVQVLTPALTAQANRAAIAAFAEQVEQRLYRNF